MPDKRLISHKAHLPGTCAFQEQWFPVYYSHDNLMSCMQTWKIVEHRRIYGLLWRMDNCWSQQGPNFSNFKMGLVWINQSETLILYIKKSWAH